MLNSPFSCPFPAKMTTVIHLRDPWRVLSARWLDHTVDQRQHDPHAYSGLKYQKKCYFSVFYSIPTTIRSRSTGHQKVIIHIRVIGEDPPGGVGIRAGNIHQTGAVEPPVDEINSWIGY